MEINWMGRYRELIETLVRHINFFSKELTTKNHICDDLFLTAQEWQVLEYIVEHEQDDDSMKQVSDKLAIPQSSFSKCVKLLCEQGLVDKYQLIGNRKNIILKPSERGKEVYQIHAKDLSEKAFKEFFDTLEGCSDEDIKAFTKALTSLMNASIDVTQKKLIKLK